MTVAIVLFVVALLAELVAVGLIVNESRKAGRLLQQYLAANPNGNAGGSWGQVAELQPVIVGLLADRTRRSWAVVLILVGVIAGFAGNLASLG